MDGSDGCMCASHRTKPAVLQNKNEPVEKQEMQ